VSRRRSAWAAAGGALVFAFLVFPLYSALVASLTPEADLFDGFELLPRRLVATHYRALFAERDFWLPLRNSLVIAASTTVLCITLGAPAAYALTRLPVPRARLWLAGLLVVGLFPQISLVPPLYLMLRTLHLIDTYTGLVLPYLTFALPLTVWLLVGVFRALPPELEEAALIDGASRLRAFREIVLPLALPALAASSILTFIYCWNEFLFALSFTLGPERQTTPVAVALFRAQYRVPWGEILAASVVTVLPVAVLILAFQRRIVRGLTAGAVRG
jgi:ABC-type glycerol-3-phosphate transport system permease component